MRTTSGIGLVLAILCFSATNAIKFGVEDALTSAKDITRGVVKGARNLIPTPEELFDSGKQLIAGYPFEVVFSAINQFCSAALASQTIKPKYLPQIDKIQFEFRTACNRYLYPLQNVSAIHQNPDFDPHKKVVIYASGWNTNINESKSVDMLAKAYNCRGDVNFMAVDVGNFVETLYTWSAFNTEELGLYIAQGIVELIKTVPLQNIHLIGHSLGAHIVGSAGRNFHYMTGKNMTRITGLDPAKPCFNEGETLSGLLRGDADFIDVIHSNPGVLGKRDPLGDVDFYPGGLDPLITGCLVITCAHARAWEFYAETVYPGNELNFIGTRCSSLKRLRDGKCLKEQLVMGYAVPHDAKGNYFLEVQTTQPFGMGANKEEQSKFEQCGLCPEKGA